MKFSVQVEFKIGDLVYVKNDTKQLRSYVRGYLCSEHEVWYEVKSSEGEVNYYYAFELSAEEDTVYKIKIE